MSIIIFTDEQLKQLQDNPYVKNVSSKAITYTREFKELFLREYDDGKKPTEIFRNAGFDTKALGSSRIFSFYHRITNKGIEDNRILAGCVSVLMQKDCRGTTVKNIVNVLLCYLGLALHDDLITLD